MEPILTTDSLTTMTGGHTHRNTAEEKGARYAAPARLDCTDL